MKKNDIEEYENKKLRRMTKKEEFDYIVYKILVISPFLVIGLIVFMLIFNCK